MENEQPKWHRADNGSILLYTLKQHGWHKGQPIMVNDLMIRIENANGSTNDLNAVADKLLAALNGEAVPVQKGFDLFERRQIEGMRNDLANNARERSWAESELMRLRNAMVRVGVVMEDLRVAGLYQYSDNLREILKVGGK